MKTVELSEMEMKIVVHAMRIGIQNKTLASDPTVKETVTALIKRIDAALLARNPA